MYPIITAFEHSPDRARGEARPAYRRAFAAQLAVFENGTAAE